MTPTTSNISGGKFKCKQCGQGCKTLTGLKIHMMSAHEGRKWSRRKKTISVDPVEVKAPKTLRDVKHCPGCGADLEGYRVGGPVAYCPIDGVPLHLWVQSVQIVDAMESGRIGAGLDRLSADLQKIL